MKKHLGWIIALTLFSAPAFADVSNRQIFPLGEKESYMGNAGTGHAWDTGAVYYNPAGLTEIPQDKVSVTGSLYLSFSTSTDAVAVLDSKKIPYDAGGFNTIPGTFVAALKHDEWTVAFSALVPESLQTENRSSFKTTNTTGDIVQFYRVGDLWLGLSGARKLNDQWSVGFTVFGINHSESQLNTVDVKFPTSPNSVVTSESRAMFSSFGLSAVLGVAYKPSDTVTFGLRVQTPLVNFNAKADTLVTTHTVNNGSLTNSGEDRMGNSANYQLPLDLTFGSFFQPSPWLGIYWDSSLQMPTQYNTIPGSTLGTDVTSKLSYRTNLGLELGWIESTPIRLGFLYDPSTAASSTHPDHIDYVGLSGGFLMRSKHLETGLGGFYLWGSGTNSIDSSTILGDVKVHGAGVLLTTAYLF